MLDRLRGELGIEELGDAEVEELGNPVGRDQDVAGLEVAVDDEVLVGVLNRGADHAEEPEALPYLQPAPIAEHRDRLALDVLHDEVGKAVLGVAAVQQARDVGVVEAGEDLPFLTKSAENEVGVDAALDDLDRHALLVLLVGANGEVDVPHPTAPEQAVHPVRSNALARGLLGRDLVHGRHRRGLEEVRGFVGR